VLSSIDSTFAILPRFYIRNNGDRFFPNPFRDYFWVGTESE